MAMTCIDINRAIKSGALIYARVHGFDGELRIEGARVGLRGGLQVRVMVEGEMRWRNVEWSSVRRESA